VEWALELAWPARAESKAAKNVATAPRTSEVVSFGGGGSSTVSFFGSANVANGIGTIRRAEQFWQITTLPISSAEQVRTCEQSGQINSTCNTSQLRMKWNPSSRILGLLQVFEISIVLNEIQENDGHTGGTKTELQFTRSGMKTRLEALEFLMERAEQLFPDEQKSKIITPKVD
jgi:hypothetical protein